jgi:signal transduction histidine kinase
VEVIDTGPGVPPDERRSIFDTFFRGRAKSGGRVEGSGLGLAIAREFVQAHGGTIGVVSDGQGSRFSVVLPRQAGGAA